MCARNTCINMCTPARSMCTTYVPVSTECLAIRRCYGCTCILVPNNSGKNGSFISEILDNQKTSDTLSFVLLSAFVLITIQFSKSKHRPF